MPRTIESSPNFFARIDGLLYLAVIVLGGFAEGFVADKLIVSGDAALTVHNITGSASLWNISVAADVLVVIFGVPSVLIEYWLFKPAGKHLAALAAVFILLSLAVETVSKLFLIGVLAPLDSAAYLQAFDPAQLQTLAYLALKSHNVGWNLALIFFGCGCVVQGCLLFTSGFLPRFIAILLVLAGVCYVIASFAGLFSPSLYAVLAPAILIPPFIGESALCLWLLIRGVDVPKWRARVAMNRTG